MSSLVVGQRVSEWEQGGKRETDLVRDQLVDCPDAAAQAVLGKLGPHGTFSVAGPRCNIDCGKPSSALVYIYVGRGQNDIPCTGPLWDYSLLAAISYRQQSGIRTEAMMSSDLVSWYHSNSKLEPAGTTTDEPTLWAPFTLQLTAAPRGSVCMYIYRQQDHPA